MVHKLLFATVLGASLLVTTTTLAQSKDAVIVERTPVRASATKLQSDARRLDAHARGLERAAARRSDRATEQRARAEAVAKEARRVRGTARARLEAKADDLRTSAAIADAAAAAVEAKAAAVRAEARKLRAQARRRAKAGAPSTPARTSSLALASSRPCRVTIDGASYGFTPHARIRLAPGVHDVVCETLDGVTMRHRVVTRSGTIRKLHFDTEHERSAAPINPFS